MTRTWRLWVTISVLAGLVALLYRPVFVSLVRHWWVDENYSHGFLIPLMSAYFAWERRERLQALPPAPSLLGLGLLASGVGLFLLGTLAAELFTTRMSLLFILTGLVLFFLGWEHLRLLAFPILYLVFMIPPPAIVFNAIAFPLQLFAARMATDSLQLLDIPVYREGNLITLANTALDVAEACSGIRSLITLLALGTTLAYFTQKGIWRQVVLLLSAVPTAIIANASRVAGTAILAHLYGDQVAQGFFHTFSGWLVFLVAVVLLGATGLLLSKLRRKRPGEHEQAGSAGVTPHSALSPGGREGELVQSRAGYFGGGVGTWRVGAAAAVLVVGIVSVLTLSHGEAVSLRRPLEGFPIQVGKWRGIRETLPPPVLNVLQVSDYMMRLYAPPGGLTIWLYVGYFESQRQGQIIHSPQQCLPGSGWNFLKREYLALRVPGRAEPVTINNVLIGKGEDRQIVLYWYQERGRVIANEYAAKLYMVTDAITRNRTDGALVRFSAPVKGSAEETLREMLGFVELIFPNLTEFLPG